MPLLGERQVDQHGSDLSILMILEGFDANVIEISHAPSLWRLRARRPRFPR
jgi:hypothetical protein